MSNRGIMSEQKQTKKFLSPAEDVTRVEVLEHKQSLPTIQLSSSNQIAFTEAVKTGNRHTIAHVLNQGYIPPDLNIRIKIKHSTTKTLLEILLESHLKSAIESYRTAKKLAERGAKLPAPDRNREKFHSLKDYFSYLVLSKKDLFIALVTPNTKIMREQDAEGNSLLHHAARMGKNSSDLYSALILDQLFSAPLLDLSLQNLQGANPLHLVSASPGPITQKTIFPRFIKAVLENYSTYSERMHYFSMLDAQGLSAIHYIVGNRQAQMNIGLLVEQFPTVNLNVPAASGITPLPYAIKNRCFHAADRLVEYHVNIPPELLGKKLEDVFTEELSLSVMDELLTSEADIAPDLIVAEMLVLLKLKTKIQHSSTLNFDIQKLREPQKPDIKSRPAIPQKQSEASEPQSTPFASRPSLHLTKQTFFHSFQPREPFTRERVSPTDCFVYSRMDL